MLQFLWNKIKNRKWLMLCLLAGNLLLVSVLCCITMYSDAIQSRILERRMDSRMEETGEYPMQLSLSATLTVVTSKRHTGEAFEQLRDIAENFAGRWDVPLEQMVTHYTASSRAVTELRRNGKEYDVSIQVGFLSGLEDHIQICDGELYTPQADADGIYPVIAGEKFLAVQKLTVGEVLDLTGLKISGKPVRVRIVGAFRENDTTDTYWVKPAGSYDSVLFMPEETFKSLFVNPSAPKFNLRGMWYLLFDYGNLSREDIERIAEGTQEAAAAVEQQTPLTMSENYLSSVESFMLEDNQTGSTLRILQAPILVLLLAFIMMVSRQTVLLEQGETAVLKSRGKSSGQIILLYVLQSLIIALAACIPGVLLGALLCELLGSANAFLEFVGRTPLKISLISAELAIDCAAAVVVSVIVTVIPAISAATASTVSQRQKRRKRRSARPMWQKLCLDIIVLLIGLYGWYSFSGQQEALAQKVLDGESLDPLLYFSSVLFMLGAGLTAIRIVHLLPKLVSLIGKKFFSPMLFASFTSINRTGNDQNFIIVFLVLTISLGIFNADTARTINANDENNIAYAAGADVVLREVWEDTSAIAAADRTGTLNTEYIEPDISRYLDIEGVRSAARVYKTNGTVSYSGYDFDSSLIGIDVKEFGQTANMPDGITPEHWYNYLNAMAKQPDGVLVSLGYAEYLDVREGDTIYITVDGSQLKCVICGIVEYFPGEEKAWSYTDRQGHKRESYSIYMVANLAYLQTANGLRPYEVWLSIDGSSDKIYDYLAMNGIRIESFTDATQTLIDHKNDAMLQGTNGMLTIGFLIVLLLCVIGFLIFWVLSIRRRTLQFGVFRAMGMQMREIIGMLITEQVFVTGLSVGAGVGIGKISSKLFIPLIQIAYTRQENILPLIVISRTQDTVRILLVAGVMIIACIAALGVFISRTGIAQALKLGEDS